MPKMFMRKVWGPRSDYLVSNKHPNRLGYEIAALPG
jgi:hypothetical protein